MEERVGLLLRHRLFTKGTAVTRHIEPEENRNLIVAVASRANPVDAPEAVHPQGRFASTGDALAALKTVRDATIDFAQNPAGDLTVVGFPHPVLGVLTGYQWLLAVAAHTERHVQQIQEIKSRVSDRLR